LYWNFRYWLAFRYWNILSLLTEHFCTWHIPTAASSGGGVSSGV
jgi:hypothetical protein